MLETPKETPPRSNLISPFSTWDSPNTTARGQTLVQRWGWGPQQKTTLFKFLLWRDVSVFCGIPLGCLFTWSLLPSLRGLFMFEALEEEKSCRGEEWLSGYTWHRRPAGSCTGKTWINVWKEELPPVKSGAFLCMCGAGGMLEDHS